MQESDSNDRKRVGPLGTTAVGTAQHYRQKRPREQYAVPLQSWRPGLDQVSHGMHCLTFCPKLSRVGFRSPDYTVLRNNKWKMVIEESKLTLFKITLYVKL